MDRPHRGPAGTALASHTPATADLPVVTPAPGTAKLIEARNLEKLFGQTPALRGATTRGMIAGPEVLFADEPTGSLDSVSGELVMSQMTRAAREQGTTVILVTHDARVAAYADREVIVRDGTVSSLTAAAASS